MKKEQQSSSKRILTFDIDSQANVTQVLTDNNTEATLENTLLAALYPNIKVAKVKVPMGFFGAFEESAISNAMARIACDKVEYHLSGATNSAKEGEFDLVDSDHSNEIAARFQFWPEAAIVYFGILISACKVVIDEPEATVLVVQDHQLGTNDCRGWIRRRLFDRLQLPEGRMYQFRLAFESTQAKGCLKVMEDNVADLVGADIVLPASSVKPGLRIPKGLENLFAKEGRRFKGRIVLGIRDVSEQRDFGSSYQLIEHAPDDSIQLEILPEALKQARRFSESLERGDYEGLLEITNLADPEAIQASKKDPELRTVEAALLADRHGDIARFPYVNNQLNKMLARWVYRTSTGGGLRLPGFILGDDGYLFAHEDQVYAGSDWIPQEKALVALASQRGLCVRYPIRSFEDLLPVEHMAQADLIARLSTELERQGVKEATSQLAEQIATQQLFLHGVYVLHSEVASKNGGDFDGDYVCEVQGDRFPRFVKHRFETPEQGFPPLKNKVKAKSAWWNLPAVAMKARGNQIGRITDLKTSCLAAGQNQPARLLVVELQKALDSLKWNVEPDREVLDRISKQVKRAPWLAFKKMGTISKMLRHLDVDETDRIGKIYNHVRNEIPDLAESKGSITEFKMLISHETVTREMHDECRFVNGVFAAVVGRTLERQDRLDTDYERAKSEFDEVRMDANKLLRQQKYDAKQKAYAARRLGEERTRKEISAVHTWVRLWAEGKTENRLGWAQALLTVVSSGHGTGAILFHAFPQEIVDQRAKLTGGKAHRVLLPDLDGKSTRIDSEGRTFLIEPLEDGGTNETFLFRKSKTGEILLGTID